MGDAAEDGVEDAHPLLVAEKERHAREVKHLKDAHNAVVQAMVDREEKHAGDALQRRAGAGPSHGGGPEQSGGAGPVSGPEGVPVVASQQPDPAPPLHGAVSETSGVRELTENLNTLDMKAGSSENAGRVTDLVLEANEVARPTGRLPAATLNLETQTLAPEP